MDDTSVDTSDTQYDDSGSSDDSSYSSSTGSDSGSESSTSYYSDDDSASYDDSATSYDDSSDEVESVSTDDSGADDSSTTTTSDDSSTEPTTSAEATGVSEPVTAATTSTDSGLSETTAAVQDPAAVMDCPPAFPLSGVGTTEGISAPGTIDPAAAGAADAGTPASTVTAVPGTESGFAAPTAVDATGAEAPVTYSETVEPAMTTAPAGGNEEYATAQQPTPSLGIPHGILSPAQEQAFMQSGWTPALVADGHGGQVEVLQPSNVDPTVYQGQVQFLESHLQNMIAQQQAAMAPSGTVAPVPGTNPAVTPVAFNAAGQPTHVVSTNVVNTTTNVAFGNNNPLYSGGQYMGGNFPQGTTMENFGGAQRLGPGFPSTPYNNAPTTGAAALVGELHTFLNISNNNVAMGGAGQTPYDPSTGTYSGDGRPFDSQADAGYAERNPQGPVAR